MERDVTPLGPIMLQDHGNPVRFRSIRLAPMDNTVDLGPAG
jgi:hypothetical protein